MITNNVLIVLLIDCFLISFGFCYDSSYVHLLVKRDNTAIDQTFCVNFEQWRNQQIAVSESTATPLRLGWWAGVVNNTNVCYKNTSMQYRDEAVALNYRLVRDDGHCALPFVGTNTSFKYALEFQVNELRAQNASAAIMLVDKGRRYFTKWSDYLFMDFYDPDLNQSTKFPVFFMYRSVFFKHLLGMNGDGDGQDLQLFFYRPLTSSWDISMLIIWWLAMFCVTAGGYWAGHRKSCEERTSAIRSIDQIVPSDSSNRSKEASGEENMSTPVNCFVILFVMVIIVGVLMLGFYFRYIMVYVFNVFLAIVGTFSVHRCLTALFGSISKCGHCRVCISMNDVTHSIFRRDLFNCECCSERPRVASVLIFVFSTGLCLTWFIFRIDPYAFILLDFINVTLCLHVLKGIRFPNLKWLTILLFCMFVYDIFMVFGTPFLTKNGCSVMIEVAAGVDCSKDVGGYPVAPIESAIPEKFPMLFQVPRLSDPMLSCVDLTIEKQFRPIILGLGDIIVPGYLISFCFTVDFAASTRHLYGIVSIAGYGIGLIVTFIALTTMQIAQPALIYLIPFTLIPIVILAFMRRELKFLWTGEFPKSEALSASAAYRGVSSNHSLENTDTSVAHSPSATDFGRENI